MRRNEIEHGVEYAYWTSNEALPEEWAVERVMVLSDDLWHDGSPAWEWGPRREPRPADALDTLNDRGVGLFGAKVTGRKAKAGEWRGFAIKPRYVRMTWAEYVERKNAEDKRQASIKAARLERERLASAYVDSLPERFAAVGVKLDAGEAYLSAGGDRVTITKEALNRLLEAAAG